MKSLAVQSAKNKPGKMLPIYIACIAGVILVVSIIVILMFVLRRKKHNKRKPVLGSETMERNGSTENLTEYREMNVQGQVHVNEAYSEDNEAGCSTDIKNQNANDYYNVIRNDTNISELRNLILNKKENDTFQEEYGKLPNGLVHPHTVSVKPGP